MKKRNRLPVFLATLVLLVVVLVFLASGMDRDEGESAGGGGEGGQDGATVAPKNLSDVSQARFISIFVSDPAGNLASYMVGGGTPEFDAFTMAIADAQPATGASDETFSDLLVISFGANDTLELSYSPSRNQFILEGVLYQPADNLSPMIANVESKFE